MALGKDIKKIINSNLEIKKGYHQGNVVWENSPFQLNVEVRLNKSEYLELPWSIYIPIPIGATRVTVKNVGTGTVDEEIFFYNASRVDLEAHQVERWMYLEKNRTKSYTLTSVMKFIRLYQYGANSIVNTSIKFT